jgi:exodeoxyribonuclease I
MRFVFYDTETTGTSTDFDQILQFAAILTDGDLREVDRIELRCRLHPHVVPHPAALRVTGMSIARISDPSLPCHYEMMRAVEARLRDWSPAIFVGYNSMAFDEHLLRQALFRTLHQPYLTNTGGNGRADALALVQAASVFAPGCIEVPLGDRGRPSFKLDRLAPSNGFGHANAHDALADVEATIHLARCVRARAPESWERFVRFSSKAAVVEFIREEPAFLLTEFYFNRPHLFPVAPVGTDPDVPSAVLCLSLLHDPAWVAGLPDGDLAVWVGRSPKPVRRVRTNACPGLAPISAAPPGLLDVDPHEIRARADRLRADPDLRSRLVAAVAASATPREPSAHVEERLYASFVAPADARRMEAFHEADWTGRVAIVESFEDERLRYHGRRLVHELRPELLAAEHREEIEAHARSRLLATDEATGRWTSIPAALQAVDGMLAAGPDPLLEEYRLHLVQRMEPAPAAAIRV